LTSSLEDVTKGKKCMIKVEGSKVINTNEKKRSS